MRSLIYLAGFLLGAPTLYGSPVERQYTNSSTIAVTGSTVYETVVIRVSSVTPSSISTDTRTTTVNEVSQATTVLNTSISESPAYTTDSWGQVLVYVTHTQTITYSYLHTTLTDVISYIDDARTHRAYNGAECAYNDFNCPVYSVSRDPIQSELKSADDAACLKSNGYTQSTGFGGAPEVCCGGCELHFLKVDVFYFPTKNANGSSCIPSPYGPETTSAAPLVARNNRHLLYPRFESLGTGSTEVINGYTFISPSIYVGFSTVYANNACGPVGGVHTNFTLGFAPGELSTLWAPFPAWPVVTTRPFDVNSVTCGDRPVISAPPELLNYDPAWKTCGQDNWQGVDPPYVLVPAPYLNKDPPIATVAAPAQTTPASPGPTPVPAPAQTPTAMFNPRPVLSMADPVKPAPATNTDKPTVPQPGVLAPSQNVDPFKQPVDPGQSPKPALTKPADPVPVESPAPTPVIIATYITTADGAHVQTVPILSLANFPPALDPAKGLSSADLGAIILSAFNNDPSGNPKQPPDSKPTGTPAAPRPSAGADPASPVPISTFRVDPGTHNTLIQPADPVFTAAGQTIKVPNPSEVVLGDGKTLTLSGSTLTINNTPFYLGSAGLVIGSSTIPIPLPATAPLTVTSAAVPTLLALGNGTTLTLGGPTLTIHGTTVYYGSAGLVVGSSTIPVPGGQVSATMTASTVPTSGSLRLSTAATAVGTGPSSVVINPFKGAAASRGRVRWEMVLLGLSGMGVGALVL